MGIPDCGTTMNEKHAPCSGGACAAIVSFIDWNAVAAQAPPLHGYVFHLWCTHFVGCPF